MSNTALSVVRKQDVSREDLEQLDKSELIRLVLAHRNNNVAVLGEDQCFVQRNRDGLVETFKASVPLYESKNEIYRLRGKWSPTAPGYRKLNQVAGLSIITPEHLTFEGERTSNPYIHWGDETRRSISFVATRLMVLGPGPTGNLVVVDRTLVYNIWAYHLENLKNKVSRHPECGGYGTMEYKPKHLENRNSLVPIPDLPPVVLWVDISHTEIQNVYDSLTQSVKFAERRATTMCERNCLKSHPAIAVEHVEAAGGVARVTVYGTRNNYDQERLQQLADRLSRDQIDSKNIEVDRSDDVIEATVEDLQTSEEHDEHSPPPPEEDEEEPEETPEPVEDEEHKRLRKQVLQIKKKMEGEGKTREYFTAIQSLGIRSIESASAATLEELVETLEGEAK